ncbi:hypothetical protein EDD16DRAFT_1708754 [Pisolithus croceorrhizus]|nr:hypothetical protein EDD16DRAFT_1708754 [Pisolithus croceorrhizus]
MVYASSKLEALTGALLAFAMMPQFKEENPPEHLRYNLSDRYKPSQQVLNWFLSGCVKPLQGSISLVEYYEQCEQEKDEVFAEVTAAWPCMEPPSGDFQDCMWYDMDGLDSDLSPLFASCYQNMELKDHLNCMESILDGKASSSPLESLNEEMTSPTNQQLPYSFAPSSQGHHRVNWDVTLEVLLHRAMPSMPLNGVTSQDLWPAVHHNNYAHHHPAGQSQTWYLFLYH